MCYFQGNFVYFVYFCIFEILILLIRMASVESCTPQFVLDLFKIIYFKIASLKEEFK